MPIKKGTTPGVKFSKTNQPKNNGRKKSRMTLFIEAFGMDDETRKIGKEDAYKLLTHLLSCSKADLKKMADNADLPIAVICQIKAIITDMEMGKTDTVDKLFDRLYGRPTQTTELTGANGSPLIPAKPIPLSKLKDMLKDAEND